MTTAATVPFPARVCSDRLLAVLIALATVLALLLMAHHPTVQADAMAERVAEITRDAALNRIVHAGLIGLLGMLLFAFHEYSRRPINDTPLVRAAFLAFAVGSGFTMAAALVSGLVVPDLAQRYVGADAAALEQLRHLLRLCWRLNQACAVAGEVARDLAIVLWSCALLRSGHSRLLGAAGLLLGGVPALALLGGWLQLHLHGALLALAALALWNFALAIQLWRGRA